MDIARLKIQLVRHEGLRLKAYRDTAGKVTIGVGRNLDDRGISQDEARMLLDNDISYLVPLVRRHLSWFDALTDARQRVLVDMAFNLGPYGLFAFKKMLAAAEAGDYSTAADEMLASTWAQQVQTRANDLAQMMRDGN